MLGASINYPLRGAVTWKSIVGTNVAADALSNLASPGVIGGAMIILGEDYGEGASVIQERSYAYAMKSSMWLLDPRPDLPTIVRMVEKGFELSEASHAPVMLELRIRACHVTGEFAAKNNRARRYSGHNRIAGPPRFDYARLAHPPVTFVQERLKVEERLPAAQRLHPRAQAQRVHSPATSTTSASSCWAGSPTACCARSRGSASPTCSARRACRSTCSTSSIRWCRTRCATFCAGKRAVLMVEEGSPDYIEQADQRRTAPRRHPDPRARQGRAAEGRRVHLRRAARRACGIPRRGAPAGIDADAIAARVRATARPQGAPPRPRSATCRRGRRPSAPAARSGRCSPPSSSLQRELGPTHISADIGCHSFATFAPFSMGNSILGYGMSLASAAAVAPNLDRRPIAVMGDGGFWHNGLITGVASNLFNKGDGVLIVMQNGYTSATGQQYHAVERAPAGRAPRPAWTSRRRCARSASNGCARCAPTASPRWSQTLKEAMRTAERGLKVIIADGECQLARQRRVRAEDAEKLKRGERVAQDALRRRRRDLHRRPFLHPPVRLPVADGEAQSRSAAHRSGRDA